jgi:hypothetical protein
MPDLHGPEIRGRNMKKIMIVCFICLLSLSLSSAIFSSALAQGDPGSTSKITLQYLLDEPTVDRGAVTLAGPDGSSKIYDSVMIPGLNNLVIPGEPVLPVRTARILIPYGEEVQDVKVVAGNEKYLGSVSIKPGQNSVPIGFTKNCTGCNPEDNWTTTPELTLLNEEIYGSEDPYPVEAYSVLGVQKKHGYKILYINLYPIKYIPKTGEAYSFGAFDVEVATAPAETLDRGLYRGLPEDREEVDAIVDNPEKTVTYPTDLPLTGESLLLNGDYDYVIITNQYLKEAPGPYNFSTLADWKTKRGVEAAIVTVEDIYANYRRSVRQDDQEVIREFIKDAHNNNNIEYVLLGGDGDGGRIGGETWDAIVPARGLWAWAYEPDPACCCPPQESVNLLSDLYYACLDGNYDYNNNGIYGEEMDGEDGDWVDLHAEVYVGRAPVDNYDELSNFVRKTIAYESTNETDRYLRGIWMVGEYMEPMIYPKSNVEDPEDVTEGAIWGWGGDYKDEIKPLFPEDVFYVETLYDRNTTGDECDCNQYDWSRTALMTEINANYIHAINHVGTSNFCDIVAYVMKMGYNHADALNNTKYFFGYSQAGYAASFDNRDPAGVYLPHDCVLEHFVTAPAGAFAFIGNTRYGLIDLNDVKASPSQRFDEAFWDEMFNGPNNVTNIGKVNQLSKERFIGVINDTTGRNLRYCYYGITLLGDPETPFKIPPATLGTTEEMPEAAEVEVLVTEASVTEAPVTEASKAVSDAEKVTRISPSLDIPDLFGDGMGFDANTFEFEEIKFDFSDDFGDSMNF